MISQRIIDKLLKSGNWMVRFDNDGMSYWGGFRWKPKGRWTYAPDWDNEPICGHGLHGQNPKANGHCGVGSRLVLCETKEQVVIEGSKVKTPAAKIIAVNDEIPPVFLECCSLDLRCYSHPLPAGLTSVGGDLYLERYEYPLPASLTKVGRNIYLNNYEYPLPAGLTFVGFIYGLENYKYPLPTGLQHRETREEVIKGEDK